MMKTVLLLFYIILSCRIVAQVAISEKEHTVVLQGYQLKYYINDSGDSTVTQIHEKLSKFKPIQSDMVNLGFERKDVWFYFETKNQSPKRLERLLRISNPIIDEIDIYKRIGKTSYVLVGRSGDQRPFAWRYNGNRELIIPLKMEPHAVNGYLFRINNGGEQFYFQTSIEKESTLQITNGKKQVFYGLLFGVMFFIIVLNLFVGMIFKQRIAYLYTIYGATFTLLQLSLLGFGTTLLWKDQFYLSNHANPILATVSVLFFLRFSYVFLELDKHIPKIKPIVQIFQISLLINLILSFIPGFTFINCALVVNALTLLLNLFIIYPLIVSLKSGSSTAKSYLLAFSVLQISVFAFVLRNFGLLPNSFLAENGLQIGTAVEMTILTFGILQRFKSINDDAIRTLAETNQLKENINQQLEVEVALRTHEIRMQRNELEVKNEEITSSIEYAKRIQFALLPSLNSIQKTVPKLEISYHPKDIVAGDFYWFKTIQINELDWHFIAVADCTGHGVPGAMMSVLCMNALDESSRLLNDANPAELLHLVNNYLHHYLATDGMQLADGMDISMVCFQSNTRTLRYSGANNPLWYFQGNEIHVIAATKRPVGKSESVLPFEMHEINYHPTFRFLLFSDGCIDQFGALSGKKLKTPGFKNMALEHQSENLYMHFQSIEKALFDWKGTEEQLDDICFILCELD